MWTIEYYYYYYLLCLYSTSVWFAWWGMMMMIYNKFCRRKQSAMIIWWSSTTPKKSLQNVSSILMKHKILVQIDCHGSGSAECILTITMVCLCVSMYALPTIVHRRNIWVPSKYSYFIPYSCWLWRLLLALSTKARILCSDSL